MISNYKQAKEDVLKAYTDLLPVIKAVKKGKPASYDSSLETLKVQADNIRQDKFLLMIVGEAKAGKSTFINAYLGNEILPMDVKQCTSAIVEIRYGKKFILKVTYADGRQDTIDDEQKIKKFLVENGSLDDNYRDIPVSTINIEILMVYGDKPIPEKIIVDLLKAIEEENIYNLPKKEYEAKVRAYIKEKKTQWKSIVKKMEIEYPFEDEDLKGIEIVDSPGVNAQGRVGDITNSYIEKANAVMFLKPLTGAALEATSFKKFLDSKSADRNKNAMFLILTRAANETTDNISRIHEEALRQFPAINPKQIIPVDSKVEMFINKVKDYSTEELQGYLMAEAGAGRLDSFLLAPWFTAQGNRDKYIENLKKLSRFAFVDDALNLFAHKAQYLALSDFMGRMLTVMQAMQDKLEEEIGYYREKAQDPIELANKMNAVKRNLEDLTFKINRTVDNVAEKYSCTGGEIDKRANAVISEYEKEIKNINPDSSNSVDELEKISFRKIDIFTKFEAELQKNIVAECDAALIALSDKSKIKYSTLKPDLTKEKIEQIKSKEKDKAYETKYYTTGTTFKKTESYSAFSQSKYFNLFKGSIEQRIKKIKNDAVSDLKDFVIKTTTAYSNELAEKAKIKRDELNIIVQEKQTADEIQETIRNMEGQLEQLAPMFSFVQGLKGGIEKNVG